MLEQIQVNEYKFDSYTELNNKLLYLDWINNNYKFNYVSTTPDISYRFQGNLFGLFRELQIPPNLFLFTMYLNGYTNPVDFDGTKLEFKLAINPPIPKA